MAINTETLFEQADAKTVAEHIGMQVVRKGNHYCISCPGHENRLGKPDSHIGNCVLTPKGYHCFACGVVVNMVDMVKEFTGCNYKEALETIAESCGGKEYFFTKNVSTEKRPTLSNSDLELIGLCTGSVAAQNSGKLFLNASDTKPIVQGCAVLQKGDEFITYEKVKGMNLARLLTEEPQMYRALIARKAKEAMAKYQKAITLYGSRNSAEAKKVFDFANNDGNISDADFCKLKNVFQNRYWRAKEIFEEYKEATS